MYDPAFSGECADAQLLPFPEFQGLHTLPPPTPVPEPLQSMRDLKRFVAAKYRIRVRDIEGQERGRTYAVPRHEYMWMARQVRRPDGSRRHSFPQIAASCENRDHSSAVHACRRHEERRAAWATVFAALGW